MLNSSIRREAMTTTTASPDTNPLLPAFTHELAEELQDVYQKVRTVIPEIEWPVHAVYIKAIRELKQQRNAVILAHNYQTPEIFHGVADITGDSLALAKRAADSDADVIVLCGVHFMAETAKLLNPDKTVLIPDLEAGCSLAASITGRDVRLLKERYPGLPVVTYVNTSAEVKAETDICCTSSNAVEVVESLGAERVIFLPDEYLGRYVASQTSVKLVLWKGRCEVHERFTADDIRSYREDNPGVQILAHPECSPEVLAEADFTGSTSGLIRYLDDKRPQRVCLITECSMSDNVTASFPEIQFVRPCNLCPHMKRITLPNILTALERLQHPVEVPEAIAGRARRAVERMLAVGRGRGG
jgi:quinolinate synthase